MSQFICPYLGREEDGENAGMVLFFIFIFCLVLIVWESFIAQGDHKSPTGFVIFWSWTSPSSGCSIPIHVVIVCGERCLACTASRNQSWLCCLGVFFVDVLHCCADRTKYLQNFSKRKIRIFLAVIFFLIPNTEICNFLLCNFVLQKFVIFYPFYVESKLLLYWRDLF